MFGDALRKDDKRSVRVWHFVIKVVSFAVMSGLLLSSEGSSSSSSWFLWAAVLSVVSFILAVVAITIPL